MKTEKPHITLVINLDNNFLSDLDDVFDDELKISQKKWKLSLASQDVDLIKNNSIKQLKNKISEITKIKWKDINENIKIWIPSPKSEEIELFSNEKTNSKINLLRMRDGWYIDSENTEESVNINEFYEYFINQLFTWYRTAIFYAVGSFAD
jgi:CRISPR/Cas system CMR-associated protein Cmr1 (group 7 of RAMP superfamily)